MKITKILLFVSIVLFINSINLYAFDLHTNFNYDKISISFSYNISTDASSQYYYFKIYKYDQELQDYIFEYLKIPYQYFSIFFIYHKNIFSYGVHTNILLKLPINDDYTILAGSANILFGLESNIPESIFIFQSGISFGLYYQYFSIPGVSYNNLNNEGFYDSEFSILLNFYFAIGIKINDLMNLKLMLFYSNSLLKTHIDYYEPFLSIVYEIYI